jgi:glycosyltransferase involved in cell wall biosynthesis
MQKTGVIIPCYEEASRLSSEVFLNYLSASPHVNFLFVNDGSKDNTLKILLKLKEKNPEQIDVLDLEKNCGKAEAVRQGMLKFFSKGTYDYIGFWDADLATPLTEINHLLQFCNNGQKRIVMASRMKRLGAAVERKTSRHIFGRVFSTFASIILKLPVYDTQCGAKLFHSTTAELFNQTFVTKWLFDMELLARFRNKFGVEAALNEVIEVPVNSWKEIGGSKLKLKHLLKVPFELMKIRNRYNG